MSILLVSSLEGEGPATKKSEEKTVFISCAREDSNAAKRLWKDLKDAGLNLMPASLMLEKYDVDERKNTITNALSDKNNPLILVDNFETILYAIPSSVTDYNKENNGSTDIASLPSSEDNAIQIKDYLNNNIPDNTSILVTSQKRFNLDSEKRIELEGLTENYSNKLFERLAVDEQLKEISSKQ